MPPTASATTATTRQAEALLGITGRVGSEAPRFQPRRRRTIGARNVVQAITRLLAWLTDLVTILIMAYIIHLWPGQIGAVAGGIVGAGIAMVNDSWEMVSNIDPTGTFRPLHTSRAVLHDLFSLAICMGGLMLIVFADIREKREAEILGTTIGFGGHWGEKRNLMTVGEWLLGAVAIWRFGFALWGGCACTQQRRDQHRRRRARRNARERARARGDILL